MFYNFTNCAFTVNSAYKCFRKSNSGLSVNRRHTAISLRLSGRTTFEFQNKKERVGAGDIVFIPPGVDYYIDEENVELIALHLNLFGKTDTTIRIMHTKNPEIFIKLFERILEEWKEKREGYEYRCTSLLYSVFSELEKTEVLDTERDFELIKNGVIYLRENFFKQEISIAKLSDMCNLSEVYFRKLFKKQYGISPLRELARLRINLAKALLEIKSYTIAEVSEQCGFSDCCNFSTFFKRETGKTPTEYKKEHMY